MDYAERGLVGLGVFVVLLGIYAWYDHGRALECRVHAQSAGASVTEAVRMCKR